jgi:hypothetical protein
MTYAVGCILSPLCGFVTAGRSASTSIVIVSRRSLASSIMPHRSFCRHFYSSLASGESKNRMESVLAARFGPVHLMILGVEALRLTTLFRRQSRAYPRWLRRRRPTSVAARRGRSGVDFGPQLRRSGRSNCRWRSVDARRCRRGRDGPAPCRGQQLLKSGRARAFVFRRRLRSHREQ